MIPFFVRERLKWPGRPLPPVSSRDSVFHPPTPRGRELAEKYGFEDFGLGRDVVVESLGVLDLLDRLPERPLAAALEGVLTGTPGRPPVRALDVGSKSWRYAPGLRAWWNRVSGSTPMRWSGIEVDAFRLRRDLTTGYAEGVRAAERLSFGTARFEYVAGDARAWSERVALVTWFFPFVLEGTHRAWGLPRRLFDPEGLAERVCERLQAPGMLIMANQGQWEWDRAATLISRSRAGLRLRSLDVIEGSLHPSDQPIFFTCWTREQ